MSPGVWPRSMASLPSAIWPGLAASRCISEAEIAGDGGVVEALEADHHQTRGAVLAGRPGAVVVVLQAWTDALEHQAHLLAHDVEEPLHAQDVVALDCGQQSADEVLR